MADVKLRGVEKFFGETQILHGIDLDIADGEFVVLVGPSGCGKSTTLRIVAGLEEASQGEVFIGGDRVNDVEPKNRDIAMVFQNYALYPHMNVFENMAFGLKLRKFSETEIRERVEEAAEILGIESYLQRRPRELSGGQRQRVAVGRAIVRKPEVFLFDEPLSNLDAKLRVQMRTEIKKLHARLKTTMIYVTHDQVEAMTMGDRIVVLKEGHILQSALPLEIYEHPDNQFVAGFIGSPAMNFIPARIAGSEKPRLQNAFLDLPFPAQMADRYRRSVQQEVLLGIRPEHLQLNNQETGMRVRLDVSELMGNETYLYCHAGETEIVARVQDTQSRQIGDSLYLQPDPDKLHLFDPATGARI